MYPVPKLWRVVQTKAARARPAYVRIQICQRFMVSQDGIPHGIGNRAGLFWVESRRLKICAAAVLDEFPGVGEGLCIGDV